MSLDNIDETIKILGIRINKVNNKQAFDKFVELLKTDNTSTIYTPNPEIIMMAQDDQELSNALFNGDLIVPDGIGLLYASKLHKLGLTERVTGFDLMEKMIEYSNRRKLKIFLLGSKPKVAEKAAVNINKKFSNVDIVGTNDGYFDEDEGYKVLDLINEKKPDILFVALGASKQEKWIEKNKKILNTSIAMGVGGCIDVWAGEVKRAPKIFIKMNLEWLYRFIKQPSRFKRMLSIPKFICKIICNRQIEER
jgi:N-acetylglucosaminyldiphosphoundecaprenol N-acetyl-beta-D-mannosaminyltransferase